jgi:hypothetical protein
LDATILVFSDIPPNRELGITSRNETVLTSFFNEYLFKSYMQPTLVKLENRNIKTSIELKRSLYIANFKGNLEHGEYVVVTTIKNSILYSIPG